MIRFENIEIKQNLKMMENSIKHTYLIDGMSCGGRVQQLKINRLLPIG